MLPPLTSTSTGETHLTAQPVPTKQVTSPSSATACSPARHANAPRRKRARFSQVNSRHTRVKTRHALSYARTTPPALSAFTEWYAPVAVLRHLVLYTTMYNCLQNTHHRIHILTDATRHARPHISLLPPVLKLFLFPDFRPKLPPPLRSPVPSNLSTSPLPPPPAPPSTRSPSSPFGRLRILR